MLDLGRQQLVGHGQVPDLGLEAANRGVAAVGGRVFNDASPAARKASRQALSSAAGTESSLDNSSRSSPRNSRNTALCLRFATCAGACQALAVAASVMGAPAGPAPRTVVSVMLTSSRSFTKHKAVSQLTVGRRRCNATR